MQTINAISQFIIHNKKSLSLFIVIGGLTTLINFGVFTILWKFLGIYYQVAVSIAFVCGLIFHFTSNRYFTFKGHGANFWQHFKKYILVTIVNYFLTIAIVQVTVETWHLSPYWGMVFSIGATLVFGYLMAKLWIYQHVAEQS